MRHTWFVISSARGRVGCSHFVVGVGNADVSITCDRVDMFSLSLGTHLGARVPDSDSACSCLRRCRTGPHSSCTLPAVREGDQRAFDRLPKQPLLIVRPRYRALYKLKLVGASPPAPFSQQHLLTSCLCHILVILTLFLTFSLLLYQQCRYYSCLGATPTAPISVRVPRDGRPSL